MVYLTRVEHFCAAHKLHNPNLSEAENQALFGKCANPNWHGHNYRLHVTVKGVHAPHTGFVINAINLSAIIKKVILEKVDHLNLNLDVDFMQGILPSAENLLIAIWQQLTPHITGAATLHCIRLEETDTIYAEYYGE